MTAAPVVTVVQGNALDLLPEDMAGFHTCITDLPYSPHVHNNAASHGTNGRGSRKRNLGFDSLGEALRITAGMAAANVQRWSLFFQDHESTHLLREAAAEAGAEYIRHVDCVDDDPYQFELPWERWSQPQLSGDRPPTGSEAVLHFHRPGAKRWNGPGNLTAYHYRCLRGADKHPTEKPLDLILSMVSWYSDPGEDVLDFTAGMATTGVACALLGRGGLCLEIDEAWAERGAKRVEQALAGNLSERDRTRALEWIELIESEAGRVPTPRAPDGSDVKTWERAQRRVADAGRVRERLGRRALK